MGIERLHNRKLFAAALLGSLTYSASCSFAGPAERDALERFPFGHGDPSHVTEVLVKSRDIEDRELAVFYLLEMFTAYPDGAWYVKNLKVLLGDRDKTIAVDAIAAARKVCVHPDANLTKEQKLDIEQAGRALSMSTNPEIAREAREAFMDLRKPKEGN